MAKKKQGNLIASAVTLIALEKEIEPAYIQDMKVYNSNGSVNKTLYIECENNRYRCYEKETYGFDLEAAISERDKLMISKSDPKRLKELVDKLNYFEYGVIS